MGKRKRRHSRGRGDNRTATGTLGIAQSRKGGCFCCGKHGHIARDCPSQTVGEQQRRPHDRERRFFDKLTKDPSADIQDAEEAERLLKAAVVYADTEGTAALLYRLADPDTVEAGALRKALEHVTCASVFTEGFLPLLELLGREELHKPVYSIPLETVLSSLYALKFLVPQILRHLESDVVTKNAGRTSLIWFFTKITIDQRTAREEPNIKRISEILSQYGRGSEGLQTILAGKTIATKGVSLSGVRQLQTEAPGGRHDNDFADFRSIQVLPTREEFMYDSDPYLPSADDFESMTQSQLLDGQFRLLREDLVGPAKEEQDDPRKQQRDLFFSLRISHVESGAPVCRTENGKETKVMGPSEPCVCFSLQVPKWHRVNQAKNQKEKEEYWEKNRRSLPKDALVCILRQEPAGEWVPVRFGVIKRREAKELAGKYPIIGIRFFSKQDTMDAIAERYDPLARNTRLMVVSSELFAYQPILEGLQSMVSIPFADEILCGQRQARNMDYRPTIAKEMEAHVEKLDPGQKNALEQALNNRVALIHGPSGAGKTFIGVMLAKIILTSTPETILCVCYTNNALDDFLEGLIDAGITEIVRLGGRSKNARLTEYNLNEKAGDGRAPFTREQTRRYAQLKEQIEEAQRDVRRLEKDCSKEIGAGWWRRVGPYLEDTNKSAWIQLRVDTKQVVNEDGFKVHGVEGEDHLWKLWLKGKQPSATFADRMNQPLWQLSKADRQKQKFIFQQGLFEEK